MASEPEPITLTVSSGDAGERLDIYLVRRLEGPSRSAIQDWIRTGRVTVEGANSRAAYRTRAGDHVAVLPPAPTFSDLVQENIPLEVVHEDPWLIVINKPAGLVVHPGAGKPAGTLANALLHHFRQLSHDEGLRPGIVHRLDKNTSGLLVVAKNEMVHDHLARQFQRRQVEKHYVALVHGDVAVNKGVIDVPLGRDPIARTKMSTRGRKLRTAVTEFLVLKRFHSFSLLRLILHTGRTHQIRVHLQHLRHPVVGDRTYGGDPRAFLRDAGLIRAIQQLNRHFLHAVRLSFTHPQTGERLSFEAPLPVELADFLTRLE